MADHIVTLSPSGEVWAARGVTAANLVTRNRLGLPPTATKAEVLAVDPNADWVNNVDDLVRSIVRQQIQTIKNASDAEDRAAWLAAAQVVIATGTNAQKNVLCQAVGLPNGSLP